MGFKETWWKDGKWAKEELIKFGCRYFHYFVECDVDRMKGRTEVGGRCTS